MFRLSFLSALMLASLYCIAQVPVADELRAAFEADQDSRAGDGLTDTCGDETRRMRVLELLALGLVTTPEAKYHAAMILQHTPQGMVGATTAGASDENYLLAHFLARAAAEAGYAEARWLAAAALDRYLVSKDRPQKYGTQFSLNPSTGFLEFDPVDPATSDTERAEWDVPPLEQTLRRFAESGLGQRKREPVTLAELACPAPDDDAR